jgi:hypothetical protein
MTLTTPLGPTINSDLGISSIEETDYTPKNTDGAQPVGNMTVEKVNSLGPGQMETSNVGVDPQNISFSYIDYDFQGVQQIAYAEIQGNDWWTGKIELRFNETIRYDYYANDTATLLSYRPELPRPEIIGMMINSTPVDIDKVEKSSLNGFLYNYSSYHKSEPTGTLIVEYLYDSNITISRWRLRQKQFPYSPEESPYINLREPATIQSYYNYTFQMGEFNLDLNVDLLVNLPDVEYITINDDLIWMKQFNATYTEDFEDLTQLSNKTFRLPDLDIDSKFYILEFSLNHTIEIVNKFSDYWSRDYLVGGTSTRIREFDISVIEGPETILVSNFLLNISDFFYEEFMEVTSNFGRPIETYNMRNIGDRTQNGTRIDFYGGYLGLTADYYLMKGEVDTISLKYRAPLTLNLKVVDRINNPLKNAEIKVNLGTSPNATYGTFISENLSLPYAWKITNSLGRASYYNVPRSNFTVDVYYQNRLVAQNVIVNPTTVLNVIYTTVPHFPTWIIIFSCTSALIGAVGFVIMKKAKK